MKSLLCLCFLISSSLLRSQAFILVLGTAQDGGFPHIGCQNECQQAFENPQLKRYVVSLALVDPNAKKWWLFEATPDMDDQLQYFQDLTNNQYPYLPEGIFLTHAHIGHYTGLLTLGREALGADNLNVYALPKMRSFLQNNGPWSQLVELNNIGLIQCSADEMIELSDDISVIPFTVPHRDEFSETAGFKVITEENSYLFIPDINKWSIWNRSILEQVKQVDVAFLDASFYEDGELPNRSISEVPHPFVVETMNLFANEPEMIKSKVHMIHFNHTNPLLFDEQKRQVVIDKGFKIAEQGKKY
jgi:pyrroloquinoline quinone biosynthesis protein B